MSRLTANRFLWLLLLLPAVVMAGGTERMESAFRLKMNPNTTIEHPTYFACFVTPSKKHPGISELKPKIRFTPIFLTNYAQYVRGFNGVGTFQTTAGYLNSHYFKAYHDEYYPKTEAGLVDAFVLWFGFQIECHDITKSVKLPPDTTHQLFEGVINYRIHGKDYKLKLAGSDYT